MIICCTATSSIFHITRNNLTRCVSCITSKCAMPCGKKPMCCISLKSNGWIKANSQGLFGFTSNRSSQAGSLSQSQGHIEVQLKPYSWSTDQVCTPVDHRCKYLYGETRNETFMFSCLFKCTCWQHLIRYRAFPEISHLH